MVFQGFVDEMEYLDLDVVVVGLNDLFVVGLVVGLNRFFVVVLDHICCLSCCVTPKLIILNENPILYDI